MRKLTLFLLPCAFTCLAQSQALALAFQAQAVNSLYTTHQAISETVNRFSARPEERQKIAQSLQNYQLMSENLALQLRDLTKAKEMGVDSVFLQTIIYTQENLARMAAAYRRFLGSLNPEDANTYNALHKETWDTIKQQLYLEENNE